MVLDRVESAAGAQKLAMMAELARRRIAEQEPLILRRKDGTAFKESLAEALERAQSWCADEFAAALRLTAGQARCRVDRSLRPTHRCHDQTFGGVSAVSGWLCAFAGIAILIHMWTGIVPIAGAVLMASMVTPVYAQSPRHPCAAAVKRCDGTISVPLDWRRPGGERVTAAFAWVPRSDLSRPATGTIMANGGGPTRALGDVPSFQRTLGPLLVHQNLLIVELRGFGAANTLRCPGLDLDKPATIRACASRLGARTRYFSSDQVAGDMDAIRAALGVPKVSFYGNSYGTVHAQAYATRFPTRVAAIYLDSVLSAFPNGYFDWGEARSTMRTTLSDLDAICDRSPACRALPGRSRDRWVALIHRLRSHPDKDARTIDLSYLASWVGEPGYSRDLDAAVVGYLRGDPAALHRIVREDRAWRAGRPDEGTDPEGAALLSYTCADAQYPFDHTADIPTRHRQLDAYLASQPYWPYTNAEMLRGGGDYPTWCAEWPTPRPSPPVPPRAAYPDVPVLVVNGQLDTTTTPSSARKVADRFPNSRYVEVPFGNHASGFGESGPYSTCVRELMRAFLAQPSAALPGKPCSAENYRAHGHFPRTLAAVRPATGAARTDAQLLAAVFATADDVLGRRNPTNLDSLAGIHHEPGLRGGAVAYDDEHATIRLDQARFVADLPVTGTVRYDTAGRAIAVLATVGPKPHRVRLQWLAFRAENSTQVTGSIDGHPVTAAIPLN
ncbi:alpha/beta fold hydrolase [Fodinicola acaciae]|uniref:alpha/beta fold hydrolase n=1 Tax=Fodinicola acaciae TaxID=2681555 RepID=UPI0013D281FB|nr:alpha/beta fold hydrolase [Fodinicola acaciae]